MTDKKTQVERFKEAARELETDDDEKRFNEKLGKIAQQKPADPPKSKRSPLKQVPKRQAENRRPAFWSHQTTRSKRRASRNYRQPRSRSF
jgi:hypothetical protein